MPHALDGARFKVVWAQQHLDSLKSAIGTYLNQQTNEVRSQPHVQHTGLPPVHFLKPIIPSETSRTLSGIIGDIVTNARAALDYIVWELAQRYFSPPLDITKGSDRKLASFPLFETPAKVGDCFDCLADRQIPTGAILQIKAAQPYNTGYEPIGWLAQLVNQDKHRLLLPTIGDFDHMTLEFERSEVDGFKPKGRINIPRKHFAAIGKNPVLQSDMQMKAKAAIYVTWEDVSMPREPLDRTLEDIVKCVADIVPRFDSFFI